MANKIFDKGRKILFSQQSSVLSAASIIMLMVIASRVLGLIRQRVLAYFFTADNLSLFFAAFHFPDLIFEILVFGTFASAFIPVFTKTLKKGEKDAWEIASSIMNIGFLLFVILAVFVGFFANNFYHLLAPGYSASHRETIVSLTRILFAAQGFFVLSYVLTAVLESSRRFLIPAIAPLFYNLGIIVSTIVLAPKLGLMAPTLGVMVGAALHFLIQFPLAYKLGFRFRKSIRITPEVKKVGRLALPRMIEVGFQQILQSVELFLSSLLTSASYTYYTFGTTLQLLPVGLFGTSIAKAALPTLSRQTDDLAQFKNTLFGALNQIIFLVLPISASLIVLRIPLVRLVFGTSIFSWEATVQTGMVVSAFAVGVVFQAASMLLARGFYALHDTKTPMFVTLATVTINIIADFVFVRKLGLPAWGLAAGFSLAAFSQAALLFLLLNKKIGDGRKRQVILPMIKSVVAAFGSGSVMFLLLKIFDRSVWIKRLSFLGRIDSARHFPFEKFVLDTRYTANLLILTLFVIVVGIFVYLTISVVFKSKEVWAFFNLVKKLIVRKVEPIPAKELETVTPTPTDSTP